MRIDRLANVRKEYQDIVKYLVLDVDGNAVYVGPNFYFCIEGGFKSFSWKLAGASLLIFACCFASGFFKFSGMNTRWMLLPYIPEVLGCGMALWAAGKGLFYSEPLRYHQYHGSYAVIPARFLLAALSAFAGFVCIIIYNILHGMNGLVTGTLFYLLLRLLVLAGSVIMIIRLHKVDFVEKAGIDKSSIDLSEADLIADAMDAMREREKEQKSI